MKLQEADVQTLLDGTFTPKQPAAGKPEQAPDATSNPNPRRPMRASPETRRQPVPG